MQPAEEQPERSVESVLEEYRQDARRALPRAVGGLVLGMAGAVLALAEPSSLEVSAGLAVPSGISIAYGVRQFNAFRQSLRSVIGWNRVLTRPGAEAVSEQAG